MKKKNRITALALVLTAGMVCVTGCGSSKSQESSSGKDKNKQREEITKQEEDQKKGNDKEEDWDDTEQKSSDDMSDEKSHEKKTINEGEKQVISDDVINNGGTVIACDGKTYYWKYNEESFNGEALYQHYAPQKDAKNELVCVSEDGSEEVLYTGNAGGALYIMGDRLYFLKNTYNENGYSYTDELVYMKFVKGKWNSNDIHRVGNGEIKAVDTKRSMIIFDGDLGDGKTCLYAIDQNDESTFIGYAVSFVAYEDGMIYYQDNSAIQNEDDARNGSVALYQSDLEGDSVLLAKTEPDLYEFASGGKCVIECAQVVDDMIYFSYGRYDGSAYLFQGGNIARVSKNGTDYEVVTSIGENNQFYVYSDQKGEKLIFQKLYNKNLVMDLNTGEEKETSKPAGAVGKAFAAYSDDSNETKYYLYQEADGKVSELFSDIDYKSENPEEAVSFKDVECVGEYVYYRIDYGMHNQENDVGWRYSYDREKTEVYRKNLETDETELLYEY
ncbi:MAG: hypothetical protein II919_06050 [Lachnospiraceae bacterium]|nr:hypothetical protein [Lachnospiraceae bacterium]